MSAGLLPSTQLDDVDAPARPASAKLLIGYPKQEEERAYHDDHDDWTGPGEERVLGARRR